MKKFVSVILVSLFALLLFSTTAFAASAASTTPDVDKMKDVVISVTGTVAEMKTKGTKQHRIKVEIGDKFDWIFVEGTEYIKYEIGDPIEIQIPMQIADEFNLGYVEWQLVGNNEGDHVTAVKTDGDGVFAIIEKENGETIVVEICEAFEITLGETVKLKTNKKGKLTVATYELWRDTVVVSVKAVGIFCLIALVGGGIFFAVAAAKGDLY